jgi:hypothetical protein
MRDSVATGDLRKSAANCANDANLSSGSRDRGRQKTQNQIAGTEDGFVPPGELPGFLVNSGREFFTFKRMVYTR